LDVVSLYAGGFCPDIGFISRRLTVLARLSAASELWAKLVARNEVDRTKSVYG